VLHGSAGTRNMTRTSDADLRKVLVVDDEPFMRRTIKAVLRMAGKFLVEEADDGDAALALLPTFKPDIVLCDVQMLRGHREAALRDTPVIMLTGNPDEATVLNATRLKVSGYLVKPVSPKQLAARIEAALTKR
jgi:two-component system, chemotaxis family, chemotaxis protein CheY